jgi:hypothetical protein
VDVPPYVVPQFTHQVYSYGLTCCVLCQWYTISLLPTKNWTSMLRLFVLTLFPFINYLQLLISHIYNMQNVTYIFSYISCSKSRTWCWKFCSYSNKLVVSEKNKLIFMHFLIVSSSGKSTASWRNHLLAPCLVNKK